MNDYVGMQLRINTLCISMCNVPYVRVNVISVMPFFVSASKSNVWGESSIFNVALSKQGCSLYTINIRQCIIAQKPWQNLKEITSWYAPV